MGCRFGQSRGLSRASLGWSSCLHRIANIALLPKKSIGAKFSTVRLRVADLMEERGVTPYRLAAASGGRIAQRTAYRLANREKAALYPEEIAALCDVLGVGLAELFEVTTAHR